MNHRYRSVIVRTVLLMVLVLSLLPSGASPVRASRAVLAIDQAGSSELLADKGKNGKPDKGKDNKPDKGKDKEQKSKPSRSRHEKEEKPGKEKPDKPKKEKKEKPGKDEGKDKSRDASGTNKIEKRPKQVAVESLDGYTINVSCAFAAPVNQSTCTFIATASSGNTRIHQIIVPVDQLCAPVVESDGAYLEPDGNVAVAGYRSETGTDRLTLIVAGEVAAGGSGAYWIVAANTLLPATGPGLLCVATPTPVAPTSTPVPEQPPASAQPTETAISLPTEVPANQPTETVTTIVVTPETEEPATGQILVHAHECDIVTPIADFDWYGECTPVDARVRFRLTNMEDTDVKTTGSTDDEGEIEFADLIPGNYKLVLAGRDWCKAQADNVDEDGYLIVTADEDTNVWIFTCANPALTPTHES